MKVSYFYQPCKENALYNALTGANRRTVLSKGIKMVLEELLKGTEESVLLDNLHKYLVEQYKDHWFSFTWQKDQMIKDDLKKVSRFLQWLGKVKILSVNVPVSIAHPNGNELIEDNVSIIAQYGAKAYGAIMVHLGQNSYSPNGKTVHTQSRNNLHALVTKSALEYRYPGIIVTSVYLTGEGDSLGHIGDKFIINNTRNSNISTVSYTEFYRNGVFDSKAFNEHIAMVVGTPVKGTCYGCQNASLCKTQPIASVSGKQVAEDMVTECDAYKVPSFTEEQLKVVNHVKGPMLVCAGPGSGKTATLVGRIKALMEKGIDSDFILAITFSREAAAVLSERVGSFCKDIPTISTINALCYKILRENKDLVGEVKLLGKKEKYSIIDGLIEAMPEAIDGLSGKHVDERSDLVKAAEKRLEKFVSLGGDRDAFLQSCPELTPVFCDMAEYYTDIINANGYISFQEQISLCVKLFHDYPDVLEDYRSIYQYIMVDEFQDIDELQAEFIYLLATHENLVVVGDDDQSIYGFRGGSHRYMLDFPNRFPSAKKVVLTENFRSTKEIVKAAQNIIKENTDRISKNIVATREAGSEPVFINGTEIPSIENTVKNILQQGYSYGDIAILSQKNSTLERLHNEMESPTVLEKSLLIQDALFASIYFSLIFIRSEKQDGKALLFLCKLFGVDLTSLRGNLSYEWLSEEGNTDPDVLRLTEFISMCEAWMDGTAAQFIQSVAFELGLENSNSIIKLGEIMTENSVSSISELIELMDFMVKFEDDTKIDVNGMDSILLITNHESKGREFPVVILLHDTRDVTEESRRVLYVAMTRAEDKLYVLADEKAADILNAANL